MKKPPFTLFSLLALFALLSFLPTFAGRIREPVPAAQTSLCPTVGAPAGTPIDFSSEGGAAAVTKDPTGEVLEKPFLSSSFCVYRLADGSTVARLVTYAAKDGAADPVKPAESKTSSPVAGSEELPKPYLVDGIVVFWLGEGCGAAESEGR